MYRGKRWWLFLVFFCTLIGQDIDREEAAARDCTVYVLLDKKDEAKRAENDTWIVSSAQGFVVRDLMQERRRDTLAHSQLTIRVDGTALYLNGRRSSSRQLIITPQEGNSTFQENSYTGAFYILYAEGVWYLVNGVELEEYVYGVLRHESWPGWSLETNKAFAIVFRSYVVAKLLEARGKRRVGRGFIYDVLSTNAHQTYKGTHNVTLLRQATEETRGMVLAYNNKPIEAMYDICCGGIIPADMKGIDFESAPYLKRTYPCTYCEKCKVYSWQATYSMEEAADLLRSVDEKLKGVDHIRISKKDKAGMVHEVDVRSGKKSLKLSGKKVYSLFKDIKSYCFSVAVKAGKCLFEGDGYGHNMGLCQWGAHEMVKQGYCCTKVLHFFYPGTKLMKLEVL